MHEQKPNQNSFDILDLFLAELKKRDVLAAEEERELAKTIVQGNLAQKMHPTPNNLQSHEASIRAGQKAREKMINHNLRLVVNLAKRYRDRGIPFTDLIQEGTIGLITAVDKYDHKRGTRFSTYATRWILQAIQRAIANHSRPIRIPVHWHNELGLLNKASLAFEQKHGRSPTSSELAHETAIPQDKIEKLLKANLELRSLDQTVGIDKSDTLGEILADANAETFNEEAIVSQNQLNHLNLLLLTLTERENKILNLKYGINHPEALSNRKIGQEIGISGERVRQIDASAREKLRNKFEEL